MKKIAFILLTVLAFSCSKKDVSENKFVSIKGRAFVDKNGCEIIFNGINLVCKNQKRNFLSFHNEKYFKQIRKNGFNCVRLGVIWAGMEPEAGKINYAYLDSLSQQINWAKKHNLYVILDMHQDLYGQKYSDGAPDWAVFTDDKPHCGPRKVWSDAYFDSQAIQAAWDNFWNNKKAVDGIGLQDHYSNMWKVIADKFKNESTVIGFDLMNEPFNGSQTNRVQQSMIVEYFKYYAEKEPGKYKDIETLVKKWNTAEGKFEILMTMSNPELYKRITDAAKPANQIFDKEKLMPFYQKVTDKIRKVNKNHIVFLEHTYSSNMGVPTGISTIQTEGKTDNLIAYAPHAYDLLTDTEVVHLSSSDRVNIIFSNINKEAKRLNVPHIYGEWGAFYMNEKCVAPAFEISQIFEKQLCSNTYWHYNSNLESSALYKVLNKPYPVSIPGALKSYSSNFKNSSATFKWKEDASINSTAKIYFPEWYRDKLDNLKLVPEGKFRVINPEGVDGFIIAIKNNKSNSERVLEI